MIDSILAFLAGGGYMAILGIAVIALLLWLLTRPLKLAVKILLHVVSGWILLFVLNFVFGFFGFGIIGRLSVIGRFGATGQRQFAGTMDRDKYICGFVGIAFYVDIHRRGDS